MDAYKYRYILGGFMAVIIGGMVVLFITGLWDPVGEHRFSLQYLSPAHQDSILSIDCDDLVLMRRSFSTDGRRELKQIQALSKHDCQQLYALISVLPKQVVAPLGGTAATQGFDWFDGKKTLQWYWQGPPPSQLGVVFQHIDTLAARIPPSPHLARLNVD